MPLATRPRKVKNLHLKDLSNVPQHKGRLKPTDRSGHNTSFELPKLINDKIEKEKLSSSRQRQSLLFNSSWDSDSPIKSALDGLTEDQKTEHFNFCMKLSFQNKITTKNAFALHLIDLFSDHVKRETTEDTNFQMASLTLHASTRIYALRIDCLHTETMKMAMSLHSTRVDKKDKVDEGDDAGVDKVRAERMKKKKLKRRFVLPSAAKSLEAVNIEIEDEPHEKFGIIKSMFDETSSKGLLFSSHVISDKCKVCFAEAYPYLSEKKQFDVYGKYSRIALGITSKILFPIINSDVNILVNDDENLPVSPSIQSFSYYNNRVWLPDDSMFDFPDCDASWLSEIEDLTDDFAMKFHIDIKSPILESALNDMFEKALLVSDDGNTMYEDVNDVSLSELPVQKSDSALKMPPPKVPPPRRSSISLVPKLKYPGLSMKSFRNSFMNPPLPHPQETVQNVIGPLFKAGVDPVVGAALSGLCIPRAKEIVQHVSEKGCNPVKKRSTNRRIIFDPENKTFKKKVLQGKRNKLTTEFIKNWSISERILPRFHFYDKKNFLKTFILEHIKVENSEELTSHRQTSEHSHIHESIDKPDHSNKHEITYIQGANEELISTSQIFDYDDVHEVDDDIHEVDNDIHEVDNDIHEVDNDIHKVDNDIHKVDDGIHKDKIDHFAHVVHNFQVYGPINAEYEACLASLEDLDLVPKPEIVKKDTLHYARHSKYVDQKQVKTAIWSVISGHYAKTEEITKPLGHKNLEDQQEHLTFTKPCALSFTKMYYKLINILPITIKKNMSIPIAFSSLLQLANEKSLDLEGQGDLKNLKISLGNGPNS